jgi:cytochrome c553
MAEVVFTSTQHLTEQDLDAMARYLASIPVSEEPRTEPRRADAETMLAGSKVYEQHCAACHGEALTGVLPAMPGLLGLPRDYIAAQVGAWQSKQRRAAEPDCMAQIASRMTGEDVAAAAAWLSAQPVPSGGRPARALAAPLPLQCGSIP